MKSRTNINPWFWVPTLYFAEGVPYFLVNNISVMMFAKMGVPNDQLSFFTTLLYFPWFLKGIWSPIVDVVKTKRWWIVSMQVLLTVLCVLLTLTLPTPDAATIAAKGTSVGLFWLTLVLFIIAAFASATHDIAADGFYMLAHSPSSQAKFIGIRSTFYRVASIFGQGVLVYIAGVVEKSSGDIPHSWKVTLAITAVVMFVITIYHLFALPKADADKPRTSVAETTDGNETQPMGVKQSMKELLSSFSTFFTKKGVWLAIIFMLLYRLPEGFLIKLCQPFLVDSVATTTNAAGQIIGGGLGLDTQVVGLLYGVIGVIFLLLGGILGGVFISRVGLKRSLWWMAACMTLPCFTFVYLSSFTEYLSTPEYIQWNSVITWLTEKGLSIEFLNVKNWIIGLAISIEQFGYGFGFTAYMMYMMYFSEGEFKTSHYAICTAFMALSMMLPGFVAGKIEMAIGYQGFFWMVIGCCIATVIVTLFARRAVPEDYGKK